MLKRLTDMPLATDPDVARRQKILNILIIGLMVITALGLAATIIANLSATAGKQGEVTRLYAGSVLALVGLAAIWALNRYKSSTLASVLFLLLLIIVFAFSDTPREVVMGRSLFLFAIPIMMASVLLPPYSSFIAAAVSSLVIYIIGQRVLGWPNVPAMLAFFAIALVSWLSARSLEQALKDLRTINRELDQRVEQRTRELAESLGRNRAILNSIADGIVVFNQMGVAINANPAITRLLDRPMDKIIGYTVDSLMRGSVDSSDRSTIDNVMHSRDTSYPGLKIPWGDKVLSVSLAPIQTDSGRTIGTVAVFRDFTREAQLSKMKSAFVSIVSHELRTPLNAIMGYADMLSEGVYGSVTDGQREILKRISRNTEQLLEIVNSLLDQAQIEAGTLTINYDKFSPAELVDEVTEVVGVLAQEKGLELRTSIVPGLPDAVFSDRHRLRQVLINLVNNAIKFTDEGYVLIRAYRYDQDHWGLEVADTRIGIPEDAREYIFEPFRHVDETPTRRYAGTGLGLAIVKQLVNLMEGEITVESEMGRGSKFTVILPMVPPDWGPSESAEEERDG